MTLTVKYRQVIKRLTSQPHTFFLVCSIVFGLLFIAITPPFQTPDETVHFYRAYQVSEFNLTVDRTPAGVGGVLPKSLGETVLYTSTNPTLQFVSGAKYTERKTYHALSIRENPKQEQAYEFSATALYSPVSYAPQAMGIGLARLFRLPPILMMFAARTANLAVWIALIYFAIKCMPRKKWVVAFVGLLPMALFEAGSVGVDVMTIGTTFLFCAYIFKLLAEKDRISTKQLVIIGAIGSAMALSKQAMFIFLPLVCLLPAARFSSKRASYILKAALIAFPLVLFGAWLALVHGIDASAAFSNGQDSGLQLRFVLHHPFRFVQALYNTYLFNWGDSVYSSFIGTFGWMDAPLGIVFVIFGYASLFLLGLSHTELRFKEWLTRNQKLLVALVVIAYWGGVNLALYLVYSPVGFKIVYGMQGRYFLPLCLAAIPLFYGGWLKMSEKHYRRVAVVAPFVLLVASTITLLFRYFIISV